MKAAIRHANVVSTVSPTYAREIQTAEFGCGLDGELRARRPDLFGILNGIDDEKWDPARDPYLPQPFTADALDGKAEAKRHLLERYGMAVTEESLRRPLIGMICGFSSLVFLVLIPVPLIMLTLAIAGIYLGRQVLRSIAPDDVERAKERKRAKAGLVAGLTTLLLFIVLLIVLYVTYEPPDKGTGDLGDDKSTSQPEG